MYAILKAQNENMKLITNVQNYSEKDKSQGNFKGYIKFERGALFAV